MWTEEKLNKMLTTPSEALIEDVKKIKGDIMILGAAGKMGPTLCVLAKKACEAAGIDKKIYGVSRGSDEIAMKLMEDNGIEVIKADLLDKDGKLPRAGRALMADAPQCGKHYLHGRQKVRHKRQRVADMGDEFHSACICCR